MHRHLLVLHLELHGLFLAPLVVLGHVVNNLILVQVVVLFSFFDELSLLLGDLALVFVFDVVVDLLVSSAEIVVVVQESHLFFADVGLVSLYVFHYSYPYFAKGLLLIPLHLFLFLVVLVDQLLLLNLSEVLRSHHLLLVQERLELAVADKPSFLRIFRPQPLNGILLDLLLVFAVELFTLSPSLSVYNF